MIANKRQNNLKDFLVLHGFLDFSAFFLDRSPLGTRLDKDFSHIKGLGHLYPQFCVSLKGPGVYPHGFPCVFPLKGPGVYPHGYPYGPFPVGFTPSELPNHGFL